MAYLPVNIDISGRKVVIAGGGRVATRKVAALRKAGAEISVVAPEVTAELAALADAGLIKVRRAPYDPADLEAAFMVVAATDGADVNARIAADARGKGILVSVADAPERGDFTFPAVLRRGDMTVAVSTGGGCPAFASFVRDRIAEIVGEEYGIALAELVAEREKLLTETGGSTYNGAFLRLRATELIAQFTESKDRMP